MAPTLPATAEGSTESPTTFESFEDRSVILREGGTTP
jgi:hypothetical protein